MSLAAPSDADREALEFLRRFDELHPDARRKIEKQVSQRMEAKQHIWYCEKGRFCDGKPHDGVPYSHARSDQWQPAGTNWFLWLILSGRGSGKTRTGSEWVRSITKHVGRIAGIGRRGVDFRATMIEGDSGLIKACENAGIGYDFQPSKKEFVFENGATLFGYSAEEPDSLRGPQHGAFWMDEPSHYEDPEAVWDNLLFGLRLPGLPGGAKGIGTSTPLPNKWTKARAAEKTTVVVRASTYANLDNLDPAFKKMILDRYEGTRLGRQELNGEILPDVEGALWAQSMFQVTDRLYSEYERRIVAIDPAGSTKKRADDTGIVAAGRLARQYGVITDKTGKYTPQGWANAAIDLAVAIDAHEIIAEYNFGGEMVKTTVESALEERKLVIPVKITRAMKSKEVRADPIVAMYEQKRVFHHRGLTDLETEQMEWIPGVGASPNRIDAAVWALTELAGGFEPAALVSPHGFRVDAGSAVASGGFGIDRRNMPWLNQNPRR